MPIKLDGTKLSKEINESLKIRVNNLIKTYGKTPTLATILVGDNPASVTYVKMKGNTCKIAGIHSKKIILPSSTSTEDVLQEIEKLNKNPDINGILLQHPVPSQINERLCFNSINPLKDVDGVSAYSFGSSSLETGEKTDFFDCATPKGIIKLLDHYKISIEGKEAVIVGRSPILGKPLAMLLLKKNATVTICHSKTVNLPKIIKRADIVVGALGKPEFIKSNWIKDKAVLIDAGYNKGNIGDIDLKNSMLKSSAYTPVPGGVGPMTIITLIEQTIDSAERDYKKGAYL